ncbi:type II toxin-antitoxin system RelE/ParE family toxin [Stenotrophomonas maltophilia]|uniref:type II toxin-antitoxin system RelE/ParE family toxin n=1 Tax=Stenotrophomonas maltophilia TaxID=40324 RepID=UPI001EE48652|nr:type II toxin-antitoxin system RelE/ParE family toxin [Stenotrophomonas maltophilia]
MGITSFVSRNDTGYSDHRLSPRGLERLYRSGISSGIRHSHTSRVLMILSILDVASGPEDLAMPGLRPHKLRGDLRGHWSVWVNGNWRILSFHRLRC